jgi:ribosomal-protein-alanine N-acetyltransferase
LAAPRIVARTARQLLREFVTGDAAALFALNADPDVMRYIGESSFDSVDEARRFLANYDPYRTEGMGRWAAVDSSTAEFLGWCGLRRLDDGDVDLGYRYRRAVWGRGLATEAAHACLDLAFDSLGLSSVVACARADNAASIRIMQKLDFRFERSLVLGGQPSVLYRLLAEEHDIAAKLVTG